MNKKVQITLCLSIASLTTASLNAAIDQLPSDSIGQSYRLHEVEIISPMRSTAPLLLQPISFSSLSASQLTQYQVKDLTALTSRVPGLYIPDYGSKRSTSIYLRGTGSRTTGQTIGFYIDGVPVLKKEAFNFDLQGIQSIEVLRGPQGTLYGLNAMAGIINLNSYSAFTSPLKLGFTLGAGNYNTQYINLEHRSKLSETLGFGVQASASKRDGYFYNETLSKKQDDLKQARIATKLEYRPNQDFRVALSVDGDYVKQGAFPYRTVDRQTGVLKPIQSNDPGEYLRKSLASRLRITKDGSWWRLESATGYQYLDDQMKMDMDQTSLDMFAARQTLRQSAVSQELVFKSIDKGSPYQWVFGAFGFYDGSTITTPVAFKPMAIRMMFQTQVDRQRQANNRIPNIQFGTPSELPLANEFKKPEWGVALYHESTMNDLLVKGLSLTAGVRADYSHQEIDLTSQSSFPISITIPGTTAPMSLNIPVNLSSKAGQGKWHILPKVALQYERTRYNVYASFSQGFKSGGYNEQSIMDYVPRALMANIMGFRTNTTYDSAPIAEALAYKPELSWNYEVGGRLRQLGFLSNLSLALYYIHTNNVQVTQFLSSGVGRITTNVGTSNTYGVELSGDVNLIGQLDRIEQSYLGLRLNAGYTHARFKGDEQVDASGFLPFMPRYTYSAMLSANQRLSKQSNVFADLEVNGLGRTYWAQDNATSQAPYLLAQARLGYTVSGVTIALWGKNLLDREYTAFQTNSSITGTFLQLGVPRTLGVELSCKF